MEVLLLTHNGHLKRDKAVGPIRQSYVSSKQTWEVMKYSVHFKPARICLYLELPLRPAVAAIVP